MSETDLGRYETVYYELIGRDASGAYTPSAIAAHSDLTLRSGKKPYLEQVLPTLFHLHSKEVITDVTCPHCGRKMDFYTDEYNHKAVFLCSHCL